MCFDGPVCSNFKGILVGTGKSSLIVFPIKLTIHVGMSIRDRLKQAYENVAYSGDKTWISTSFAYQKANLDLYIREQQLRLLKYAQLRPRYVKECIPKSKLAQYDNYRYNEARELSYNSNISKYYTPLRLSEEFRQESVTEPWMLPEIDDLYVWFLNYQNSCMNDLTTRGSFENKSDDMSRCNNFDIVYESPFLRARFFEESLLKLDVTSDRIKRIWDMKVGRGERDDKLITVYQSPMEVYYITKDSESDEYYEQLFNWLSYMVPEQNSDFEHMKDLSRTFRMQNGFLSKNVKENDRKSYIKPVTDHGEEQKTECEPERRLYSAVLQGLSPKIPQIKNTEQMTVLSKGGEDRKRGEATILPLATLNTSILSKLKEKREEIIEEVSCETFKKLTVDHDNNIPQQIEEQTSSTMQRIPKVTDNPPANSCVQSYSTFLSNTNFIQMPSTMSSPTSATFSSSTSAYTPSYNYSNYQFSTHYSNNSYQNNCLYSNTYSNVSQIVANRSLHTYTRSYVPGAYQYPSSVLMLQQNRSSTLYPLNPSYVHQQTHYYNPMALPRSVQNLPPSYIRPQRSFLPPLPPHFVAPPPPQHWIIQNQQQNLQLYADTQSSRIKLKNKKLVHPQVSVLQSKGKIRSQAGSCLSTDTEDSLRKTIVRKTSSSVSSGDKDKNVASCSKPIVKTKIDDIEEVVSKTIGVVLEERSDNFVPIQVSVSEVLELQALEQYNSSNDNVYQELERQAAEQYNEYPENWKGPPNYKVVFGGCLVQCDIALILPQV